MSNYFNKQVVEPLVKIIQTQPQTSKAYIKASNDIVPHLNNIASAIIFKHNFLKYHYDLEELVQVATWAQFDSLKRFDPDYHLNHPDKVKGDPDKHLFSYLSLSAKRSLVGWTIKQSKHKLASSDELQGMLFVPINFDQVDVLIDRIYTIVHPVMPGRYIPLLNYFISYLKIERNFNIRAFYKSVLVDAVKLQLIGKGSRSWLPGCWKPPTKSGAIANTRRFIKIVKTTLEKSSIRLEFPQGD